MFVSRTARRLPGLAAAIALTIVAVPAARQNRIDLITPAAPELAAHGRHAIGVRTITVTDRGRVDVLNVAPGGPLVHYDRALTLEVWYPASVPAGQPLAGTYQAITRDPAVRATLAGRAVREAAPLRDEGPYPLVILSHGYPGNRYLLSHLGENLATKGYVTVSIDHAESTYDDQKAFASTLYHRPLDQIFVLREIARLSTAPGDGGFLRGLVDADRTGLVGYSMGGYGVINVVGGGFSAASASFASAPPNQLLAERGAASAAYRASIDARVRAAVAIGPWGMQAGFWDADGLAAIRTPLLFVAGSVDDVSGYEKGTRALFEGVVNAERYLLTFVNANHNAAAPYPAPAEVMASNGPSASSAFSHYADPVWDTARMNNILQHFATAHFDRYLKGDEAKAAYFDVVPQGRDAVWAVDREGRPQPGHTYWKGFRRGTAVGLVLEQGKRR